MMVPCSQMGKLTRIVAKGGKAGKMAAAAITALGLAGCATGEKEIAGFTWVRDGFPACTSYQWQKVSQRDFEILDAKTASDKTTYPLAFTTRTNDGCITYSPWSEIQAANYKIYDRNAPWNINNPNFRTPPYQNFEDETLLTHEKRHKDGWKHPEGAKYHN